MWIYAKLLCFCANTLYSLNRIVLFLFKQKKRLKKERSAVVLLAHLIIYQNTPVAPPFSPVPSAFLFTLHGTDGYYRQHGASEPNPNPNPSRLGPRPDGDEAPLRRQQQCKWRVGDGGARASRRRGEAPDPGGGKEVGARAAHLLCKCVLPDSHFM
jgi:hypothetical protein